MSPKRSGKSNVLLNIFPHRDPVHSDPIIMDWDSKRKQPNQNGHADVRFLGIWEPGKYGEIFLELFYLHIYNTSYIVALEDAFVPRKSNLLVWMQKQGSMHN